MNDQILDEAMNKHKNMDELLKYQKALKPHGFKYYHNEISGDNWFKHKTKKPVVVNVNTLKWKHDGSQGDSIDALNAHLKSKELTREKDGGRLPSQRPRHNDTNEAVELIDAISQGDTIAASQHFSDALMSKVSELIVARREEVTQGMFENSRSNRSVSDRTGKEIKAGHTITWNERGSPRIGKVEADSTYNGGLKIGGRSVRNINDEHDDLKIIEG